MEKIMVAFNKFTSSTLWKIMMMMMMIGARKSTVITVEHAVKHLNCTLFQSFVPTTYILKFYCFNVDVTKIELNIYKVSMIALFFS